MQNETASSPPPQLRVMQIIVIALAAGLAIFLAHALFTREFAVRPLGDGISLITIVALLTLVPGVIIGLIVPRIMVKAALTKIAEGKAVAEEPQEATGEDRIIALLLPIRVTTLIIKLAALEGPGYIAGFAYFSDKDLVGLILAASVTVVILLHFPTASGLQNWLDQQADELAKIV